MGFDWGSAVSGSASIVGDLLSFKSAKDANETNKRLVGENRQFEADMSNTAHQREVDDLRKAGLNPILSAGGTGASTPTVQPAKVDPVVKSNIVKSAMETALSKELIKSEKTKQTLNDAMSKSQKASALLDKQRAVAQNIENGVASARAVVDSSWYGKLLHGINRTVDTASGVLRAINDVQSIKPSSQVRQGGFYPERSKKNAVAVKKLNAK